MKLKFEGDLTDLKAGIEILIKEQLFENSPQGIPIKLSKSSGNIEVGLIDGREGFINYFEKIHFFRGLGLLIEHATEKDNFHIKEHPQFTNNGPMIDASRNAVLKVSTIKKLLRMQALMGLNMMMIYTEDTFTINSEPYFGYMRGRYSYDEMKSCDDYAHDLGIEMIPCIQTLAHLKQALKWDTLHHVKDTDDILLVGEKDTYIFIEKMIQNSTRPFRSKRINIGMDEAHNLGLGRYLDKNGYKKRLEIMSEHLDAVLEITKRYNLEPMMWSDMFFRQTSSTEATYDLNTKIAKDKNTNANKVQLVYWDYYHHDKQFYKKCIKRHQELGSNPIFAGGIWTWNGLCTNYTKTFNTTNAALTACKEEGIKEVIATLWGDDGNETNIFSALLGLQLFAEHGYSKIVDENQLKHRFKFCTSGDYDDFMTMRYFDDTPGTDYSIGENPIYNPSKMILWQDILIGLFDKHFEGLDLKSYYEALADKFQKIKYNDWDIVFDYLKKLACVLSLKSELGIEIKKYYANNNVEALKDIIENKLPILTVSVQELHNLHRQQWLDTYKAFGWEVLDIRYGGLLQRIATTSKRLTDYIDGSIECIEELEETRLLYDSGEKTETIPLLNLNQYLKIVTACPFSL